MTGRLTFFSELRRRNVHRAAMFYAGVAWLTVQVATQVFPFFHVAEWIVRGIVIVAIVGFPFAMVFSWFYEWTPHGIERESDIAHGGQGHRAVSRRLDKAIIAVLALAVLALLLGQFALPRLVGAPARTQKSIAVLPFDNASDDAGNQYFSDGLAEELINRLGQLQGLKVIGRMSSFQFKGKRVDAGSVGEKLGVATLLEGSVRKQGDRVRIIAELVDVTDGRQLWSDTYDRELKDIFAVQSEIADAVAARLKVALLGKDVRDAGTTQSSEAYNAVLQGRFYARRGTIEDIRKGATYFDEAIRLDPNYALGYAAVSGSALTQVQYADLGDAYALTDEERRRLIAKARSAADSAVRLAPELGVAHVARAAVLRDLDWDIVGAEREYRLAVELAPQDAAAVRALAGMTTMLGRFDAGLELARRASTLNPFDNAARFTAANCLLKLGRYVEAEAELRKAIDQQAQSEGIRAYLATVLVAAGKPEAALEAAKQEPIRFWRTAALAMALFARGERSPADAALQTLIDEYAERNAANIASIYAMRGAPEKMFEWLERGWAARDLGVRNILADPFMPAYKDDPRFVAFAKKVGLAPAPNP